MNLDRLRAIEIDKIILRDDVVKRSVNADAVNELVKSIKISGLHTPIRVRPVSKYNSGVRSEAWELIAGRHRIEAAKILGWSDIDANVEDLDDTRAEMGMIDENLCREDLSAAELVYATHRRKELYELLFPSTAHGAIGRGRDKSRNCCDSNEEPERFTLNTAKATGKSERAIQMNAAIGKKLGKDALKLVGTSLNSITELEAVAKLNDVAREDVIKRAVAGEQISAKSSIPRKTTKTKASAANDNHAGKNIPMIDLTSGDHEEVVLAVGEAVADAAFFPNAPSQGSPTHHEFDREDEVTMSSSISAISRDADACAVSGARAALDEFLGRFAGLSKEQRERCISGRDLSELFEAYTNS